MKRLSYVLIVAVGFALLLTVYLFWFSPVTTVILVRHAERLNSSDTTSLSAAGVARASTLAHVVGPARIDVIYVSDKVRTQQTAAPTAALLGITPIQITANQVNQFVDSIHAHTGDVIFIVGHSDTVPEIIDQLGVSPVPTISANEFDNLFVITFYRFRSNMTHLKYGVPT